MTIEYSAIPQELAEMEAYHLYGPIKEFLDWTDGRYIWEDIIDNLNDGTLSLWLAYEVSEGGAPLRIGGCLVRINQYAKKQVLHVEALFSIHKKGRDWVEGMINLLEEYARDTGCEKIEARGRVGWRKFVDRVGWKETSAFWEKDL